MQDTKKQHRETVKEIAAKSLASHVLTPEQESGPVRMWLCHRPGSGAYHYRVVAAPGMLTIYGDIGDQIIQNYDRDMVEWLLKAMDSPEYVMDKFTFKEKTFFPQEARSLLDEMVAESCDEVDRQENEEFRNRVLDEWDSEFDDNGHEFAKAFYEAGGDMEMLSITVDHSSGMYWTIACLEKFVELYKNEREQKTDSQACS